MNVSVRVCVYICMSNLSVYTYLCVGVCTHMLKKYKSTCDKTENGPLSFVQMPLFLPGPLQLQLAARCNILQHTATHCRCPCSFRAPSSCSSLLAATYCNTLQHTADAPVPSGPLPVAACCSLLAATYCNTLQHTATHCTNMLQHTTTHCNALQRTATHCNALQRTATHYNTLQHAATHCNTQQHTATQAIG